jgi:3-oxoacyl-[acyl-carrier-protein] synthase II
MPAKSEVVITGLGVVSPLGIGREAFWSALCAGRSGVGPITGFDASAMPVRIAAEVKNFNPLEYVRPRKSLKVMSRESQFGVAVADLARQDSGLGPEAVDPNRMGVIFGADASISPMDETTLTYKVCNVNGQFEFARWGTDGMAQTFPLGMLRLLPNMVACHVSIVQDARGPNNTIYQSEISGLLALTEAARVIERGHADVMFAGASSSRIHPFECSRLCLFKEMSQRNDDPATACRPFDSTRDGQVRGEGAACFVLESRRHAEARGARILARLAGLASSSVGHSNGKPGPAIGLQRAITRALAEAGRTPQQIGHINAHGLATRSDDMLEAQVLNDLLPGVPVTAPKSSFGTLSAGAGIVEAAVSVLALTHGLVPPTLNYHQPDPHCPIPVVHGEPLAGAAPCALVINHMAIGQAAAVVLDLLD